MTLDDAAALVSHICAKGGPAPEDYEAVGRAFDVVHRHEFTIEEGLSTRIGRVPSFERIFKENGCAFASTATMQGFARLKPHGYAGDFEMIERIYNSNATKADRVKTWDTFFHLSDGARAVRNRAAVLKAIIAEREPSSILSVGCGPALDIAGALDACSSVIQIDLLDNDAAAIARARVNLASLAAAQGIDLCFLHRNALRLRADRHYDLIWCSGLFDYLNDRTAVHLLKRFRMALLPGGMMCIGNFGPDNPSRAYMEVVGEWFLIHRSAERLERLAMESGLKSVRVLSEESGLNLFLTGEV